MAISIPTQIEQDFQSGKADYRTFQCGFGPQTILEVPGNASIIIYGYVFNPAGGGWVHTSPLGGANQITPPEIAQFGSQQILFYTGTDFYPFLHHVDIKGYPVVGDFDPATGFTSSTNVSYEVDTTPQQYQVYIKANKNVSIAHGLVHDSLPITTGLIPLTPDTPEFLTYGNFPGTVTVATNLANGAPTPNQFLQPLYSQWAGPLYAYGLYANGATDQAWAIPNDPTGMYPAQGPLLALLGGAGRRQVPSNYFITLHYALYRNS